MSRPRRQHSGELKAKVVLEARRGERTMNELATEYGVPPLPITQWQRVALEELPEVLSNRRGTKSKDEAALQAALYQQMGQLKVEWDWLKKKLGLSVEQKRTLVEVGHPRLSLRRQGALLGWARGSWEYQPVGPSAEAVELMRWLDEPYTATPFYGLRRMTAWLRRRGYAVNHQRVGRLLRQLGWAALSPQPRLSQPAAGQAIYPDLLRGITVPRVNQVWSADITSVRLAGGLVDVGAVLDWFSRYVLSWAVSITTDVALCVEAVAQAIQYGQPEIFHTDQGAPFTSLACTERLKQGGIRISLDGRGRALDHVCVERWWRSVKDEAVYRRDDQSVWDARQRLAQYFGFYNRERLQQALGYRTPAAVYRASRVGRLHQGYWAKERRGHREVLTPNLCGPQNGLDDGVHLTLYNKFVTRAW